MSLLGNVLWFLFGGLIAGMIWLLVGIICCISIVGFPVGLQCFKFAGLAFFPFGKDIVFSNSTASFLINLVWILLFGWYNAVACLIVGLVFYITIIGIPFGKQFFKFAKLWLMPFGAKVVKL